MTWAKLDVLREVLRECVLCVGKMYDFFVLPYLLSLLLQQHICNTRRRRDVFSWWVQGELTLN